MQTISQLSNALETLVSLSTALVLGTLIGYERQYRQRTAGLRTNALVAVAAAAFVDMAANLDGPGGASRVAAYVVSGVGFLGAGTIMKDGLNVRGLNTAATLWGSAAIGACAGSGQIIQAILTAIFVLAANTLLRPVVNAINRTPIDTASSEITYQLCLIVSEAHQKKTRAQLKMLLEHANYPLGELDIAPFGDDDVEMTATLLSSAVSSTELDKIASTLASKSYVRQAFWNPCSSE